MGGRIDEGTAMVVGATGSIGSVCSRLLAQAIKNVILVAPRPEKLISLKRQIEAETPDAARAAFRRNALFNTARVALAKGDLDGARAQAEEYATRVAEHAVRFEQWQSQHLNGLVALAAKDAEAAVAALQQANPLDPRVQYALARAYTEKGDTEAAEQACRKAAEHNALNFNYAYVRDDARKMLGEG